MTADLVIELDTAGGSTILLKRARFDAAQNVAIGLGLDGAEQVVPLEGIVRQRLLSDGHGSTALAPKRQRKARRGE